MEERLRRVLDAHSLLPCVAGIASIGDVATRTGRPSKRCATLRVTR